MFNTNHGTLVTELYGNARRYLYNVLVWNERLLKQQHHHHKQHSQDKQEALEEAAGEEEAEAMDTSF